MLKRLAMLASCAALALAGACARPKPAPPPAPEPALEVPVIPPRVLAPLPPEPEEPPSPEQPEPATRVTRRPAPRTPARPRTDSPANRETPGAPGTAGEAKPPEGQPGPQEAPEAKPEEPKTAALKTPQTANEDESARRIREVMNRAQKELTRVNATALGRDARVQYDTARRFIDQAEDALKVKNYMFAGYLADKAEQLARGLQGR